MSLLGRLEGRDRRAAILGLAIVGPGLFWLAGVRPYLGWVDGIEAQAQVERDLLERELGLLATSDDLDTAVRQARHEGRSIERRLVLADNPTLAEADLINELEVLGVRSRVYLQTIRSISVADEEGNYPGLVPIRLAIDGESDLQGVLNFLGGLEDHSLLIRVAGLTLDPVTESPDEDEDEDEDEDAPARPARPTGVMRFGVVVEAFTRSTSPAGPTDTQE